MSFCPKCGVQVPEAVQFCPACGAQLAQPAAAPQQAAPQQPYQQAAPQQPYQQAAPQQPYQQAAPQQPYQQAAPQQPYQQAAPQQDPFAKIVNTADSTNQFDPQDIASNKGMAVLSYIGLLALIPFFAAKNSRYAQYHAKQGMNLLLVDVAWCVLSFILSLIKVQKYYMGIPYYGVPWIISLITGLGSLFLLGISIFGIVYAATGKAKELPIFGKLRIIK